MSPRPLAKPNPLVKKGIAHFSSDAQLLAELGERLVAAPHVALAEIVKNAYDADATTSHIWLTEEENKPFLHVADNGHGMTETEFLENWMRIASTSKLRQDVSRTYNRRLSGSKGVGRFAVRMLGTTLHLETTAADAKSGEYRRLVADFDWATFEGGVPIEEVDIHYRIDRGFSDEDTGTTLRIGNLTTSWTESYLMSVSGDLLSIIEPPLFDWLLKPARLRNDPGFRVYFNAPGETERADIQTAGEEVVHRHVGCVTISSLRNKVTYHCEYQGLKPRDYVASLDADLIGPVAAEIRYFPKRPGVFSGLASIDGRRARKWLVAHSGVKIYDRGFRMAPYGDELDDWLCLSLSKADRTLEWFSLITEALFPASERAKDEVVDPLLKIPHNRQLYGAVAVSSFKPGTPDAGRKLQPAMDRQGFVANAGFEQLRSIVRAGVELFAVLDVEESQLRARREAKREADQTKKQFAAAIEQIWNDKTIPAVARRAIIENYENVAERVSRLDQAREEASRAVETMSLLGVLSGFMTHEATVMLRAAVRMLKWLDKIPVSRRDDGYAEIVANTKDALQQLRLHLDYAETFVRGARKMPGKPFRARQQVELVMRQLTKFAAERAIQIENAVPEALNGPSLPVVVYSGILLNLLTNAIKAIMARGSWKDAARVRFEAFETDEHHVVHVLDTGIGVPTEMRDRIFEPLFTTTTDSPLGAGMGLGLHIVRRLVVDDLNVDFAPSRCRQAQQST